jgi:hypothetical protein
MAKSDKKEKKSKTAEVDAAAPVEDLEMEDAEMGNDETSVCEHVCSSKTGRAH